MTTSVVHPAEMERMLQARLEAAHAKRVAPHRPPAAASRRRFPRTPAVLLVGLVLALSATAAFADAGALDVQVANSAGYEFDTTDDGAIVEYIGKDNEDFGSSGTGVINSFLQTQNTPSEEGYNTDGVRQFNTGSSPTFNRSILVSEIPVVECEALDDAISDPAETGFCWELFADINDSNANDPDAAQIQLTELEIWLTTNKNITGYVQTGDAGFTSGANEVYDFEGTVLINDVNSGSGRGDLRYLVPLTGIDLATLAPACEYGSSDCATYFVVYTEWGDTEGGAYISDSGFEEWTVKRYPSLQIVKNTLGGDGTFEFAVTGDPTDPPDTSPSITTSGGTGSTPAYVIDPGTYTVDELEPPAGWAFSGAVCSFDGGTATVYTPGDELEIDDDEHVVCTFTNVREGSITIIKDTVPDGDQDFAYTTTGAELAGFTLDDNGNNGDGTSNTKAFTGLSDFSGARTVSETLVAGWDLTNIVCSGDTELLIGADADFDAGDTGVTINLDPGEDVTCTFTNTEEGSITIIKDTVPDGDQDFAYTTTGAELAGFTLDDNGNNGDGTSNTKAFTGLSDFSGARTVSETLVAGWDLTNIVCSGDTELLIGADADFDAGDTGVTINLDPGEDVTCTFTNTELPTIIVEKITTGTAGGPFGFTTTGGNGLTTPFDLTTVTPGVAVSTSFEIASAGVGGNYSVTESTMPGGFVLTDVDCTVTIAGVAGTTTGQDLATKTGTITNLTAGTTVTCTFVNSGALTTRTQGFWSTHSWLVALVWNESGGTIDTFTHDGMTEAERTLCGELLQVDDVMGGFWSNIAKQTDGDKRSKLDQARMQLAQQLLAAILNNQLFGSAPSGTISIEDARDAFCTGDLAAVKAAASAMAAFNEGGDSGEFTPGGSADAKHAREIADLAFWDDLP